MTTTIKHTIPALLNNTFDKFLDRNAFSFVDGKQNTYKDLQEEIAKIGTLLKSKGINKNDKVAILASNSPSWVAAYYAIATLGAVSVPILPDFTEKEIASILEHSEAKIICISTRLYPKIVKANITNLQAIIRLDNLGDIPLGTSIKDFSEIPAVNISSAGYEYAEVEEDDLLTIIYTSGTTGSSKGVMLTHKNIIYNVYQGREVQAITENDSFLSILPLSHTYENTVGMIFATVAGAATYYLEKLPTPSVLLPAMKKIQPEFMLTVPLIIEKIYKNKVLPGINSKFLTRWAYKTPIGRRLLNKVAGKKIYETFGNKLIFFGIGGSKLDPVVEQFLLDSKFPYSIGYGMTETSPLIAGAGVGKTKLGSTGEPVKGVKIRIAKENPNDIDGEIQVTGDNVMQGYFKNPNATKEAFTEDGWLRTGDLGFIDKKGYIYIKGRIKTMLVGASGENIYPEEIESVINKNDLVAESLVTQIGGKIVAMVHLNMEELEKQVKRFQDNMSTFKTDAIQKKDDAKIYFGDKAQELEEKAYEILQDIRKKVNTELNKFSQIQQIKLQKDPFEKTPTQKIKRFLYNNDKELK